MPRSCIANSTEKLFHADECISDLEQYLVSILYVVGLEPTSVENSEIDNIIAALRETFSAKNSKPTTNPTHLFISQTYHVLLHKLQVSFFNLKLAKYGKTL